MDTRKTVSLQDAKTHLFELVEEVANGVEVTITKRGKVVATLSGSGKTSASKPAAKGLRKLGALATPGEKIDFKTWWKNWKAADKEMERAFERSLNESWDMTPEAPKPKVGRKKPVKGRR